MSISVHLLSGAGRENEATITDYAALLVSQEIPPVPPAGTANRYRYFNALLGTTGADGGTTNQNADGSSTAVEFYIGSHADYDIHIMLLVVVFADTAIVHNSFGNISALTNGWDLKMKESGVQTSIITSAKTGGQVIAQAGFFNAYGDGATSFELSNWTGTEDAQTVALPIGEIIPGGLRIGRGTTDRLQAFVNDDLTGLTEFTVRAIGYKHYE